MFVTHTHAHTHAHTHTHTQTYRQRERERERERDAHTHTHTQDAVDNANAKSTGIRCSKVNMDLYTVKNKNTTVSNSRKSVLKVN